MSRPQPRRHRIGSAAPLTGAAILSAALALGCTLGGGDDGEESPYDDAAITVMGEGVADGVTAVEVSITGHAGARLTLEVANGAAFVKPDANTTDEKTVFLTDDDDDGWGSASAFVKSKVEGHAPVFFKVDPLFGPADINFNRVRFALGPAVPVGFAPGQLENEICVALNTTVGKLAISEISAGDITTEAEVTDEVPTGGTCPTVPADAIGWVGYAKLEWRSAVDVAFATARYAGVDGEAMVTEVLEIAGAEFPGYSVLAGEPAVTQSYVSVALLFSYRAAGSLAAASAPGVSVDQRFIPVPEAEDFVLGSSSGGTGAEGDPMITGAGGALTVFFNPAYPGTYAWFATPQGGASMQLPDIVIPEPEPEPVE